MKVIAFIHYSHVSLVDFSSFETTGSYFPSKRKKIAKHFPVGTKDGFRSFRSSFDPMVTDACTRPKKNCFFQSNRKLYSSNSIACLPQFRCHKICIRATIHGLLGYNTHCTYSNDNMKKSSQNSTFDLFPFLLGLLAPKVFCICFTFLLFPYFLLFIFPLSSVRRFVGDWKIGTSKLVHNFVYGCCYCKKQRKVYKLTVRQS